MKCWLGHTRMEGLSGETKVIRESKYHLGNFKDEKRSVQSHVCKDCGIHFSTIKKLDQHTLDVMEKERAKVNASTLPLSLYDYTKIYHPTNSPFIGHVEYGAKKKGKRK